MGKLVAPYTVTSSLHDSIMQSYGGFMASKVAEADAGIHSLAMAIAVWSVLFLNIIISHYSAACHKLAIIR